MAKEPEKKRGPKGGIKHTPGRGHDAKSSSVKKKQFRKKAVKRRKEEELALRIQWEQWDSMSSEAQKLRPELRPKLPRPKYES